MTGGSNNQYSPRLSHQKMMQITLLAGAGRAAGCVSSDTRLEFVVPAAAQSQTGLKSQDNPAPGPDSAAAREGDGLEEEDRRNAVKPCRVGISQVKWPSGLCGIIRW